MIDPIAALLALGWFKHQGEAAPPGALTAPIVSTLPAYKIDTYAMLVVQLSGTNKLVLMDKVNTGFVTDGVKVLVLRYGTMDHAQQGLKWLGEGKPQTPMTAQYWTGPAGIVLRGPGISTSVIDNTNIATVDDTGKFLGQVFQGTTQSASALITSLLGAGADLSKQAAVHGLDEVIGWLDGGPHPGHRTHHAHHAPHVPQGYHRAQKVLHFFR
jgi:hypothetical protein